MSRLTQFDLEIPVDRVYLSPPHMSAVERTHLLDAFDSNWVAPVGPHLAAFETAFAERHGGGHAVGVSSGSAGLHLSLLLAGVSPGDTVIVPSFTFASTANAAVYCGAAPVFVDSEAHTWNLDPALVHEAITDARARGERVGAVVTVDLYGQCADYEALEAICADADVPLVEDAAEAVGASWNGRSAGSFGSFAVFSFNGNKLITTGGGGLVLTDDADAADRVRYLATQAREPVLHYEHNEVGFNYRLSNPLAAIGIGQLERLDELLARRAANRAYYEDAFGDLDGVGFNPIDDRGTPNHWLTLLVLDPDVGASPTDVIAALEAVNAEARPAWKPMHLQPVFANHRMFGGPVCEAAFARSVCLPSGSAMTTEHLDRVAGAVRQALT